MAELKEKNVKQVFQGQDTMDGAGVRLRRMFGGFRTATITDPFLLLDHFGSDKPSEYLSGFPWHPHRGIETVTYLMEGKVNHEDSEGHKGTIYPNDIQWMTAGSGIFHQEMPRPIDDKDTREILRSAGMPNSVVGMQLWINLPARNKMTTPAYRSITGSRTPVADDDHGNKIRIVAGEYARTQGELIGVSEIKPTYLEVKMPVESTFSYQVENGFTSIVHLIAGQLYTGEKTESYISPRNAVVFSDEGEAATVRTKDQPARFILLSGRPLHEPVYWHGPIVMNSKEQIEEALLDLQKGTFVRTKEPVFL